MDKKRIIIIGVIVLVILATISVVAVLFGKSKNKETPAAESLPAKTETVKTPVIVDMDNDGLTDEQEKIYGTDPANPDTDGDTFKDGDEKTNGYDPLKPAPGDKIVKSNECPPGKAKTPEELMQFTIEASAQGDTEEVICSFIPEAQKEYAAQLSDPAQMKSFGESLSKATQVEISEYTAEYKSSFFKNGQELNYLIFLIKEFDGAWYFDTF